MTLLLSLPTEIIVQVFVALLFADLNVLVRVSRAFRDALRTNAATIVRGRRDCACSRSEDVCGERLVEDVCL